jgi:hypothetical protein
MRRVGGDHAVPVVAEVLVAGEAVSQTNGIGAKEQGLGEPPETDASGELLRASAGCARLICLDANPRAWCSITNNFRSVTFVKQPQPHSTIACGREHVIRRPNIGNRAKHPAGPAVLGDQRMLDAKRAQVVAELQSSWSRADDD